MTKCYFNKDGGCSALKLKEQNCNNCSFYKTPTQVRLGREKALKRLKGLDKPTRMAIYDKYKVEGIL